jgi:putative SOS response-associated peptidase YedK
MCNLYSITTNQAAIIALFRVVNRYIGNLAPMPGVFPDYKAPIVRAGAYGRGLRQGQRYRPDFCMAVVDALSTSRRAVTQKPQDVTGYDRINIRLPTYGGIYLGLRPADLEPGGTFWIEK